MRLTSEHISESSTIRKGKLYLYYSIEETTRNSNRTHDNTHTYTHTHIQSNNCAAPVALSARRAGWLARCQIRWNNVALIGGSG